MYVLAKAILNEVCERNRTSLQIFRPDLQPVSTTGDAGIENRFPTHSGSLPNFKTATEPPYRSFENFHNFSLFHFRTSSLENFH